MISFKVPDQQPRNLPQAAACEACESQRLPSLASKSTRGSRSLGWEVEEQIWMYEYRWLYYMCTYVPQHHYSERGGGREREQDKRERESEAQRERERERDTVIDGQRLLRLAIGKAPLLLYTRP